jgi:FtsP/CotA-like multicopper oxidase with cupredoxin domain
MGDMGNMTGMDMDADAKAGGGHAGHMAGMGMDAGSTAGGGQMGAMPGMGEKVGPVVARQGPNRYGPGNTMVPTVLRNRLGEPGTGLENVGHRVLVYTDLRSLKPGSDQREPEREVELHLTGNMDNYMWSFDGQKFSEVRGPIPFYYGERLRFTMVNDTMMEHPIHLHGMFMELDNGSGSHKPRKHTISVKPAERLSLDITADAPGNWALHCHLLYHMEMGMFRVVNVSRRMAEGDK